MLSDAQVVATLPASDLDRARRFYRDMLDLEPVQETAQGLIFQSGEGSRFLVFLSAGRAAGTHTQLALIVHDLEAEVGDLKANGLTFEEYDGPGAQTVASIATTRSLDAAWFKDSEGNLLSLVEMRPSE